VTVHEPSCANEPGLGVVKESHFGGVVGQCRPRTEGQRGPPVEVYPRRSGGYIRPATEMSDKNMQMTGEMAERARQRRGPGKGLMDASGTWSIITNDKVRRTRTAYGIVGLTAVLNYSDPIDNLFSRQGEGSLNRPLVRVSLKIANLYRASLARTTG